VAIQLNRPLTSTPRRINRRQQDNLPNQIKGTAYFTFDTNTSGYITPHTRYYITQGNLEIPVEFLRANEQIHWYALSYNSQLGYYIVNEDDQYSTTNPLLGYFNITDPQHINNIPEIVNVPELHEEFIAGGPHHITTLEGPQAQLLETHHILPYIKQAAL
jgi:hypothetical protein